MTGSSSGIGEAKMFRVSREGERIEDADALEGVWEIVQGQPSGR
jgi:hypothetical protein